MFLQRMVAYAQIAGAVLALILACPGNSPASETQDRSGRMAVHRMSLLPLAFTENRGQWDERVLFQARARGMTIWFTRDSVYYDAAHSLNPESDRASRFDPERFSANEPPTPDKIVREVIRSRFEGANPRPDVVGQDEMEYKCNYFIGNKPEAWRTDVPNFRRIVYRDLYPGIDLAFYGKDGAIEYDFIVQPGADPNMISLRYDGAESVHLDGKGSLVVATARGELVQRTPLLYQQNPDGTRRDLSGGFCRYESGTLGFELGEEYEPALALVIDPSLDYGTFLGGGGGRTPKTGASPLTLQAMRM